MPHGEGQTGHTINGDVTAAVLDAIRSVRYGSVEIVIHDGRVVGIERREKVRIEGHPGR
jgi:hypothetical protein